VPLLAKFGLVAFNGLVSLGFGAVELLLQQKKAFLTFSGGLASHFFPSSGSGLGRCRA
jgi:hypothetical protein